MNGEELTPHFYKKKGPKLCTNNRTPIHITVVHYECILNCESGTLGVPKQRTRSTVKFSFILFTIPSENVISRCYFLFCIIS